MAETRYRIRVTMHVEDASTSYATRTMVNADLTQDAGAEHGGLKRVLQTLNGRVLELVESGLKDQVRLIEEKALVKAEATS